MFQATRSGNRKTIPRSLSDGTADPLSNPFIILCNPGFLQAKQIKPVQTVVDAAQQIHSDNAFINNAAAETQTQEETQHPERSGKRPAQHMENPQIIQVERPRKKTKMSLAKGVDLAE